MRKYSVGEWVAIATLVGGLVVWAVRVEGRVDRHGDAIADLKQQHKDDVSRIGADVQYIRERIDEALSR